MPSCISVVAMTGAAILIDDASAADTILSVKERVFAANRELPVRRQRLVYRPGPRGMEALADDETLGGAGVAQDGSAELDVLMSMPVLINVVIKTLQGKKFDLAVEEDSTVLYFLCVFLQFCSVTIGHNYTSLSHFGTMHTCSLML